MRATFQKKRVLCAGKSHKNGGGGEPEEKEEEEVCYKNVRQRTNCRQFKSNQYCDRFDCMALSHQKNKCFLD